MYAIRHYTKKDKKQVEQICIATAPKILAGNAFMQQTLLTVYCHYYIEQEAVNCFVAVNEQDEVVGYILCAVNYTRWEQNFQKLYLNKTMNPITRVLGFFSIAGLKPFSRDYPAHLHIDAHPDYQGKGLGTQLVQALKKHLENSGVHGLMLGVGSDNIKGQKFYRKQGFAELAKGKVRVFMGIKL